MSRAIQRRWTGRTSHQAGTVVRFCVALWLVFQIVHTPIHLSQEPHVDGADFDAPSTAVPLSAATAFVGDEGRDDDGDHEPHSARQHKLEVLRAQRAATMDLMLVPIVELVVAEKDCPKPQVFSFSGLSPPELPRRWQFFFRAALPIRAPSLLS